MLFDTPIKTKQVSKNVYAYLYRNGIIVINEHKYMMHSITSAIKEHRKANKNK